MRMAKITTRPLSFHDFPNWLPLWNANNLGQRNEAVTTSTWERLNDEVVPVYGLCALKGGEIVGILHYVLHYTTGSIKPACYMQDVFTAPEFRGQGVAKAMIAALADIGRAEKWSRLYWLADNNNEAAQALYKTLGVKLDFGLHILPLKGI